MFQGQEVEERDGWQINYNGKLSPNISFPENMSGSPYVTLSFAGYLYSKNVNVSFWEYITSIFVTILKSGEDKLVDVMTKLLQHVE